MLVLGIIFIIVPTFIFVIGMMAAIGGMWESLDIFDYRIRNAGDTRDIEAYKKKRKTCKIWFLVLIACIVVSEGAFLSVGIYNTSTYYKSEKDDTICEIVSLDRSSDMDGSFFLGSGHIDSVEYYYFYKTTDKGLMLDKLRHDKAYLVEDNSRTPCVHKVKDKDTWDEYYQIICPENTVVKEFHA